MFSLVFSLVIPSALRTFLKLTLLFLSAYSWLNDPPWPFSTSRLTLPKPCADAQQVVSKADTGDVYRGVYISLQLESVHIVSTEHTYINAFTQVTDKR